MTPNTKYFVLAIILQFAIAYPTFQKTFENAPASISDITLAQSEPTSVTNQKRHAPGKVPRAEAKYGEGTSTGFVKRESLRQKNSKRLAENPLSSFTINQAPDKLPHLAKKQVEHKRIGVRRKKSVAKPENIQALYSEGKAPGSSVNAEKNLVSDKTANVKKRKASNPKQGFTLKRNTDDKSEVSDSDLPYLPETEKLWKVIKRLTETKKVPSKTTPVETQVGNQKRNAKTVGVRKRKTVSKRLSIDKKQAPGKQSVSEKAMVSAKSLNVPKRQTKAIPVISENKQAGGIPSKRSMKSALSKVITQNKLAIGKVPAQILQSSIHFSAAAKSVDSTSKLAPFKSSGLSILRKAKARIAKIGAKYFPKGKFKHAHAPANNADAGEVLNIRQINYTPNLDLAGGPLLDLPQDVCPCTMDYNPQCGTDGKTYENPCLLRCAAIDLNHQGECEGMPKSITAF